MLKKASAGGLVLLALVMATGGATARAGALDVGASPAILYGSDDVLQSPSQHVFQFGVTNTVLCEAGFLEGTIQGQNINEALITPTYGLEEHCTVFLETKVQMNGCKFTLTGSGQPANTFLVDIVACTTGKQIKVQVPVYGCVFSIPEQSGLSHVVAKTGLDSGGVSDLTLETTLTGIKYKKEAGICSGPAEGTDATIKGNTLVQAYKEAGTRHVNKSGHTYSELIRGAKVSLTST
jgi:hypothetical protein